MLRPTSLSSCEPSEGRFHGQVKAEWRTKLLLTIVANEIKRSVKESERNASTMGSVSWKAPTCSIPHVQFALRKEAMWLL